MAGGRGSRLWPLTKNTPKPLLKINDKSVIDYSIERLHKYGITNFHVSVNYLKEKVIRHLSKYDDHINFNIIEEEKPLGTIGVLHQNINYNYDSVLVLNGDLISAIDFEMFYLNFISKECRYLNFNNSMEEVDVPYGIIESTDGVVSGLKEK